MKWEKGRGKLGVFKPLLGSWSAQASSDVGVMQITRDFSVALGGKYIELRTEWDMGKSSYIELAMFGVGSDNKIKVWSFTSDGKNSNGEISAAPDIHPEALGFESQMPAGLARQVYWPDSEGGFRWVVESKTKKGWNRFVEHHYTARS